MEQGVVTTAMTRIAMAVVASIAACSYEATFEDCAVRCGADAACPEGLACGPELRCRTPGALEACATVLHPRPSCAGLPARCGPAGGDDCCSTAPLPGGTFYRGYDAAADGAFSSTSSPATVSPFVLDKYEVTVARFRKFVEAGLGTRDNPPEPGSGIHAKIPGSGWNPSWSSNLEPTTAALRSKLLCGELPYATWTADPGANEDVPINCVTWFDAQAFCIWDGGYLPTEAEWHFAASGGGEQRAYPWSVPAGALSVDCSRANYMSITAYCVPGAGGAVATMNRVGSASPRGDGLWGHSDLGGNAWEWTLDWYGAYSVPCEDCANLAAGTYRVIRGGNFSHGESSMRSSDRGLVAPNSLPSSRTRDVGFRCAREVDSPGE